MSTSHDRALVWIRREFRTQDQTPLFTATHAHDQVTAVFVIDAAKIEEFAPGKKPHASFFGALLDLREAFRKKNKDLVLLEGDPSKVIPEFAEKVGAAKVYCAKDYEPDSIARDEKVAKRLATFGATLEATKDIVLHEESELLNGSKLPYRVFTPYKNSAFKSLNANPPICLGAPRWTALTDASDAKGSQKKLWDQLQKFVDEGIAEANGQIPKVGEAAAHKRLDLFIESALREYPVGRNLPAIAGTSRLSMDLRSGALSPRQIWNRVNEVKEIPLAIRLIFLAELIWRDFFHTVGFQWPEVFQGNFNQKFAEIKWRNHRNEFRAWCEGRTGYPIVDAGMRELVSTGFMHNRVRMITAMFLTKDLLVDWRWGEKFFREHLIDGDLPVNNGNWQWCASTGCDAQPYFRIFNPTTQGLKFDPAGGYIQHWVPELKGLKGKALHTPSSLKDYPGPVVDHGVARMHCLLAFKAAAPKSKS